MLGLSLYQLSLIALILLATAVAYLATWWQDRQYRKRRAAFAAEHNGRTQLPGDVSQTVPSRRTVSGKHLRKSTNQRHGR